MQLKISLATATLLSTLALQAEDYVSFQYLQYDENKNRTSVSAPAISINKDFGVDYTLNASFVADAVSGASETYYNAGGSEEEKADVLNTQLSFHQVLNSTSFTKVALFYAKEDGYLTNPYLNVVKNYTAGGSANIVSENRLDSKAICWLSLKYAKSLNNAFTVQSFYRCHSDDWDVAIYYEANSDWIIK